MPARCSIAYEAPRTGTTAPRKQHRGRNLGGHEAQQQLGQVVDLPGLALELVRYQRIELRAAVLPHARLVSN